MAGRDGAADLEFERVKELTLALLLLASWTERAGPVEVRRSWKGYPFEVLDALAAEGLIAGSHGSKAVTLTRAGVERASLLLAEGGSAVRPIHGEALAPATVRSRPVPTPAAAPSGGPTARQSQYLAYIHHYTRLHGLPPSENEIARRFGVAGPSTHRMVLSLEARGFLAREPGQPRSLRVLVPPDDLPELGEARPGTFHPTPARPIAPRRVLLR